MYSQDMRARDADLGGCAEGATDPAALRLSVIIPTYNRRASLLRTLNALANQTFPADAFEVIVVSDGANDGTAEAVAALRHPYSLRYMEQTNQGPSAARNRGARAAWAPVLVFTDDDIEPVPAFLEEHACAHAEEQNLVLIGPQTGPDDEPMPPWIEWEHRMLQKQYANFVRGIWTAGPNNLYSGNFSLLREHLLAAGGFNERFTRQEDVELGFRLAGRGLEFRFNPRADGIHRSSRTFEAWYRTPFEYGRRDLEMARTGGEPRALELARTHYRSRNRLTRLLARAGVGVPLMEPALLALARAGAQHAPRPAALAACSLLFNLRYLQGMCREAGGRRVLWTLLSDSRSAKRASDAAAR